MLERHARYVPVMDGSTLLGVVSFHDVAKAVLEEQIAREPGAEELHQRQPRLSDASGERGAARSLSACRTNIAGRFA